MRRRLGGCTQLVKSTKTIYSRRQLTDLKVVLTKQRGAPDAPTLTTHGQYLFAMQVKKVVEQVPDHDRPWFRMLRDTERLTRQGSPPITLPLDLEGKTRFAAGNAFPVPVIVAMLRPMLEALSTSGLDLASWPPRNMLSRKVPECVAAAAKQMKAKPRKVKTVRKALKVKQTTLVRKALKVKKTKFIL